jgi:S-adenosylmethionine:tRNA ribosyltransferase-isomerase
MRTADFDFPLPQELIAQAPAPARDGSRLLVLHRETGRMEHRHFPDLLGYLRAGDVLVLNDSRVIPARLRAVNPRTGGRFEIFLLEESSVNDWWCLMRPGKRARIGTELLLLDAQSRPGPLRATVSGHNEEGHRRVRFSGAADFRDALEAIGEIPLPPYIRRPAGAPGAEDRQRYQTVFAGPPGSVAAPTAGLHFTRELLDSLRARGIRVCCVTLHVGLGTFAPVKSETLAGHTLHEERYEVSPETSRTVNEAINYGRRVVAVGTTAMRVLESVAAAHDGRLAAGAGRTRAFLHPPCRFRIVQGLLTNFHLPRSTLLMLVCAFAAPERTDGRERVLAAYAEAVRLRYRFFSYGDAMLVV